MTTNLYYRAVMPDERTTASNGLKRAIAPDFYGHDGSVSGERKVLTKQSIPFLMGIRAGTTEDAVRQDIDNILKILHTGITVEISIQD